MAGETKVYVKQVSASASQGQARSFEVMCDRPVEKGGSGAGPMGGELFLLGLGGCFMSNLLAAIAARSSAVEQVRLTIVGQLDGTPLKFTEVDVRVSATYENREEMEKLVVIAERGCIVANTIKGAVRLQINID